MSTDSPKFSILFPTRNGCCYLPFALKTVIDQHYANVEILVSDNHSMDGTWEYLCGIEDARVKIFRPEHPLSMVEHYEWLLQFAKGEWITIVGDDDGLQPYFFEKLVAIIDSHPGIKAIASKRAYFFWPGCEDVYSNLNISYNFLDYEISYNSLCELIIGLLGFKSFFDLPQLYTGGILHKDLITEAKALQNDKFYNSIIPDANSAAIALSLTKKYLYSGVPLFWVGTSPKSNGMSQYKNNDVESPTGVYQDFVALNKKSGLKYNGLAGSDTLGSSSIYLFESALQTTRLRSDRVNKLIFSKWFKSLIFVSALAQMNKSLSNFDTKFKILINVIEANNCNYKVIKFIVPLFNFINKMHELNHKARRFFWRKFMRRRRFSIEVKKTDGNVAVNILDASNLVLTAKNNE